MLNNSHQNQTRSSRHYRIIALGLALALTLMTGPATGLAGAARREMAGNGVREGEGAASANQGHQATEGEAKQQASLSGVLQADGSLPAGLEGSFDARGYRMKYASDGSPRFVKAESESVDAVFATAAGCGDGWDDQFTLNSLNDIVYALAVSGSNIYVGGNFATAGGMAANRIARWDGTSWSTLGNGFNGSPLALAVSGSTLYAGGGFTALCNDAACSTTTAGYNSIAQWNGSSWSTLGNGLNTLVTALAISGSNVYAGGGFTAICTNATCTTTTTGYNRIAQWNGSSWSTLGNGFNSSVFALAVSGGTLYAGGSFTRLCNDAACSTTTTGYFRIAQWSGSSWSTLGNGLNGAVLALAVSGGTLYVGGDFTAICTNATCTTTTTGYNRIAQWNGSSWLTLGNGFNSTVYALAVSGSNIYAGGNFTLLCNDAACSTTTTGYNRIAQWNGSSWSTLGNGFNNQVRALVVSGSTLYAGGIFAALCNDAVCTTTTAGYNFIAQWNGSALSRLGAGDSTVNDTVYALAVSGSNIYVGGVFTAADGVAANHIARWDGTLWSTLGNGFNNGVYALSVSGNTVYAGGSFTAICTNAMCSTTTSGYNRIAQWDGNSWLTLGNGFNSTVYALAVSGSTLYAGGIFSLLCNDAACSTYTTGYNFIAQWNGSSWSTVGNGVDNEVRALAVSGSTLYAGGSFIAICTNAMCSTKTAGYNRIAQWDGSSWLTLGNGLGNAVFALAVSGSTLYAGGMFTSICTNITCTTATAGYNRIAQWNGSSWSALGNGFNNQVNVLAVSGSNIYAGGIFGTAGCHVSNFFARYFTQQWTGITNSDWHTATNWNTGAVPASNSDAVIPSTAPDVSINTADVTLTDLRIEDGRTLTIGAGRTLIINGTLELAGNIAGPGTLVVNGKVIYNGSSAQTALNVNASNVTINNPAGVTLNGNQTITGTLDLQSGILNTGANTLTLDCNASVTNASSASFVNGNLQKNFCSTATFTYPTGTTANGNEYSPLTVMVTALNTNPSSLTVKTSYGTVAPLSDAQTLDRYWTLTETGDLTVNMTFNYLQSDVDGTEANYRLHRITGGSDVSFLNQCPAAPCVDTNLNTATVNNISGFSDWTLAEPQGPTSASTVIRGRVLTADGTPVAGVSLLLEGAKSARAITDSQGNYRFENLEAGGFYTVRPELANYNFSPSSRSVSTGASEVEAAFIAGTTAQISNPIDTDLYFVRQHYIDFLSREPDAGGLDYWSSRFDLCHVDAECLNQTRISISAAFFIEAEFQQTGSFIYRLYKASYAARPSYSRFSNDRSRVVAGANLDASKAALADEFVMRAEFKAAYPDSMSNNAFVQKLFDTAGLFGNEAEREGYVNQLNSGGTRSQVLREIVESQAFKTKEYNSAFVLMQYFGYLKRDPDEDGYQFWLNVLNNREPDNYRGMVCSFITSAEYQKRFSSVVTHSNSECAQ